MVDFCKLKHLYLAKKHFSPIHFDVYNCSLIEESEYVQLATLIMQLFIIMQETITKIGIILI